MVERVEVCEMFDEKMWKGRMEDEMDDTRRSSNSQGWRVNGEWWMVNGEWSMANEWWMVKWWKSRQKWQFQSGRENKIRREGMMEDGKWMRQGSSKCTSGREWKWVWVSEWVSVCVCVYVWVYECMSVYEGMKVWRYEGMNVW
jgi:hypothetical protein